MFSKIHILPLLIFSPTDTPLKIDSKYDLTDPDQLLKAQDEFSKIFNEKRFSPKISGCFLNRDQGVWVDNGDNRMTITYDDGHADFQNTTYQITTNALLFTKGITPNTIVVAFKKIE